MPENLSPKQKRLERHYRRLRTRTPVCLTCGFDRHPAALEYSHIVPRKFHDDGGAQCHNCHSEFSDAERDLPYAPETQNPQMETLARMRRGGEQVVRHIHVDNRGGQAVIAENVNTGGTKNGKTDNQSDTTGAAGIGPAMLGTDPFGCGVPIPSGEGQEAMQNARRD